ncbi:MAG: UDP-2,3-diacylglucosamine diphosphatase [Betaproteobacteria bacterium]|nr:UDP-2,3-diacylglucosamine diphosphatase [Betaproteobacteria bacterium]
MEKVRSVLISDVHLGTRACQAERLLSFLRRYDAEYVYLVGDIIDFWAMNRGIVWSPAQNTVVQKILKRARHGEKVILIPGNHDEALREYVDTSFGGIEVAIRAVHRTANGRRYLVVHGDEFDQVTRYHRWVARLGDVGYEALLSVNALLSSARRTMRIPGYWSLSGYAKSKVKTAVDFIFEFEASVVRYAKQHGFDGVICGHVHSAAQRMVDGVEYVNCGDWVDSCTGIVERLDGRLEIIHWKDVERAANLIYLDSIPGRLADRRSRGGR